MMATRRSPAMAAPMRAAQGHRGAMIPSNAPAAPGTLSRAAKIRRQEG